MSPSASSTVCLETENSPDTFNNAVSCGSSVYWIEDEILLISSCKALILFTFSFKPFWYSSFFFLRFWIFSLNCSIVSFVILLEFFVASSISLTSCSTSNRKATCTLLSSDFPSSNTWFSSWMNASFSALSFWVSLFSSTGFVSTLDAAAGCSVIESTATSPCFTSAFEVSFFVSISVFSVTAGWVTVVLTASWTFGCCGSSAFLLSPDCFSSTDAGTEFSEISVACTIFEIPFK